MKDLKHLYYFEKLLDDANNELVRAAKDEHLRCVCVHRVQDLWKWEPII